MLIYKNERAMSFENLFTNTQKMFTGFSDNGDIINNSQNIRLLFHKVQNRILIQIKVSLQVSYDMDKANTVTYNFIANNLESEAESLVDPPPPHSEVTF